MSDYHTPRYTRRLNLLVSEERLEIWKEVASNRAISISELVRQSVEKEIKRKSKHER